MFVDQEHCLSYFKRVFCPLATSYMTQIASESETLSPEALDDFVKRYKAARTEKKTKKAEGGNLGETRDKTRGDKADSE